MNPVNPVGGDARAGLVNESVLSKSSPDNGARIVRAGDELHLSSTAQVAADLLRRVDDSTRTELITELRKLIVEGNYEKPEMIEKLLDSLYEDLA